MFERVFSDLFGEFGVRLTVPAVAYVHYGAVNGIISIIGDGNHLSLGSITERTQQPQLDLKNIGIDIDGQQPDHDLDILIRVIGHYRNVSFEQDAQRHLNTLIVGAVRGVVRVAADKAQNERPDLRYISPDDLEQVCRRLFQNKFFLC
jgi:hypothetical protein